MYMKRAFSRFMDEAGEGGGEGASSGAATEGAAGSGTGTGQQQGESGTVIQQAMTQPGQIPEKFQVKNEDGTLNLEASSAKLAEAYAHAEKRVGSGDLPPKTVGEYQITVPDALKDAWNPAEDPMLTGFLEKAHAAGYTQKQIDLAIEQYGQLAPGLVQGNAALSFDDCTAELRKDWSSDEKYQAEMSDSVAAMRAYLGDELDTFVERYGNDPMIIKLMAKVGKETKEDASLEPGSVLSGESIQELELSEAYRNPKHPQHASVSTKVKNYYEALSKQQKRTGNSPLI